MPGNSVVAGPQTSDDWSQVVNDLTRFLFSCCLFVLLNAAMCAAQSSRVVALTFDDLPMAVVGDDQAPGDLAEAQRVTSAILKTLAAHHAPAIGFVNEIKLNVPKERDARAALLSEWLKAGMELGNHTYSHPWLSKADISSYEDDFVRGTTITSAEMHASGKTEKYFRYPYLDTGKDKFQKQAVIAFYTSRGFANAPVTIQNQDWLFNAPYVQAVSRHDAGAQQRVVDAYVQHTRDELIYGENLALQSFGREIPQVVLLHADALNADHLETILETFEQRGYRFETLDQVLRDSAYSTPDDYVGSDGITWLERWQIALNRPSPPAEPLPPKWAQDEYRQITGQKAF